MCVVGGGGGGGGGGAVVALHGLDVNSCFDCQHFL